MRRGRDAARSRHRRQPDGGLRPARGDVPHQFAFCYLADISMRPGRSTGRGAAVGTVGTSCATSARSGAGEPGLPHRGVLARAQSRGSVLIDDVRRGAHRELFATDGVLKTWNRRVNTEGHTGPRLPARRASTDSPSTCRWRLGVMTYATDGSTLEDPRTSRNYLHWSRRHRHPRPGARRAAALRGPNSAPIR